MVMMRKSKLNKKGQLELDDVNPAYVGLAILAGIIGLIFMGRVPTAGIVLKIVTAVLCAVGAYAYLVMTDSG